MCYGLAINAALYSPKTGELGNDFKFFASSEAIAHLLTFDNVNQNYFAELKNQSAILDIITKCYSIRDGVAYSHSKYFAQSDGFPKFCLYRQMMTSSGKPIRYEDVEDKKLGYSLISQKGEIKVAKNSILRFPVPFSVPLYPEVQYNNHQWECDQYTILTRAFAVEGLDFVYFLNRTHKCVERDNCVYLPYDIRSVYLKC